MRRADALRQPALLQSEAVLLPALPRESSRAALSQVRSKEKNIQIDQKSFQPVQAQVHTAVSAPSPARISGSMAGRAILRSVGGSFYGPRPMLRMPGAAARQVPSQDTFAAVPAGNAGETTEE